MLVFELTTLVLHRDQPISYFEEGLEFEPASFVFSNFSLKTEITVWSWRIILLKEKLS